MEQETSEAASPLIVRALIGIAVLGGLVAAALVLRSYLATPVEKKAPVQQIAVLRQTPPPPPKPPEKPPEPQKVKEEVKIDEPKEQSKPDEAKQPDDKPASDKPLGVDADGAAGGDSFGLVGSKGGRDFLTTGGGGSGAYYTGLLQRSIYDALSRNRKLQAQLSGVVAQIWLTDDGRVARAEFHTGDPKADEQLHAALAEMPPLREVPPPALRMFKIRLSRS